jgi:starch phosphorylase
MPDSVQNASALTADESPTTDHRVFGPSQTPTHPLATAPVGTPPFSVDGFVKEFLHELNTNQGVALSRSSINDQYLALASTVRNYLMARWLETGGKTQENQPKVVGYLSAEYLLGRQLGNALLASDLTDIAEKGLALCGIDLATLRNQEVEPGLGNGGLGRLAACFIDSLATMNVPCIGYGIRYEYGIFRQTFVDGRQVEQPDTWLQLGSPWEFPHPEASVQVNFGGTPRRSPTRTASRSRAGSPAGTCSACPTTTWSRLPQRPRQHAAAVERPGHQRVRPADLQLRRLRPGRPRADVRREHLQGALPRGLDAAGPRAAAAAAVLLRRRVAARLHQQGAGGELRPPRLPERIAFQLNDTHPVIAVPELMRILVDEKGYDWDEAWDITSRCFGYTCHTLLPEALEVWPTELLGRLLPRHLEIIYRINEEFLAQVREQFPGDEMRARRMSIIAELPERGVRMAYLATVAATKVNGVAELHSQLLRDKVLPDFSQMYPDKFTNVTNGVTPRRFVRLANPKLSTLITDTIGSGWVTQLERLKELEPYADDADFRAAFREAKQWNKTRLTNLLKARDGIELPEGHLLDVMVKRLHEYKRQSLKLLHIVSLYEQVISGKIAAADVTPRTVVFGAKAAPGYKMAKETIHLINKVAEKINADERVEGRLKVAFPANYNVTLAEKLIPAADLSEQISLAGMEASGTGNMKFALNGALTIGTDDGANVEIRKLVGDKHFFLFGMDEPQVAALGAQGYVPGDYYQKNENLKAAIDLILSGYFSPSDQHMFDQVIYSLLNTDRFMALADFDSYVAAQAEVEKRYADEDAWTRSSILNVARSGYFSSDRSMRDYIQRIWHTSPVL